MFCLTFSIIFSVQTLLYHTWDRIAEGDEKIPPHGWSLLNHQWTQDDLTVVRGELPLGTMPWHDVDSVSELIFNFASMCITDVKFDTHNGLENHLQVLIRCNLGRTHWAVASVEVTTGKIFLFDSFHQQVPYAYRKAQLSCLRWLIPSMLHAVNFHRNRRKGDMNYKKKDAPFRMYYVQPDRVPQQRIGYDCLKFLF